MKVNETKRWLIVVHKLRREKVYISTSVFFIVNLKLYEIDLIN